MANLAFYGHTQPSELGFPALTEDQAVRFAKHIDRLRKADQEFLVEVALAAVKPIVTAIYKTGG